MPGRLRCGAAAAGGQRSRARATSRLKSWWGNGNFPAVLDAASDLKTTAPASPDAEQGQACKCDMTAQDTPIWLPAVRPPLGRTGWEGDAPVADAFRGGGGGRAGAGPGTGTYVQAGTRCPTPCRWDRHRRSSDRDNPPRPPQHRPGRVLGRSVPDAGDYPVPPQPGFEEPCPGPGEPWPQWPQEAPPARGAPPAAALPGSCAGPSRARPLCHLSPLRIKQLFVNLN